MAHDPQPPKDPAEPLGPLEGSAPAPLGPSLGTVTRLMFLAGADDAMVSRFLTLMLNEQAGAARQPPVIELGPALEQAAMSAGVHVARELVKQFEGAGSAGGPAVPSPAVQMVRPVMDHQKNQPTPPTPPNPTQPNPTQAKGPVLDLVTTQTSFTGAVKPYGITVSGKRTSVTLPVDLVEAAHRLLGEKATKELAAEHHAKTPASKGKGKCSEHVRDQLQKLVLAAMQQERLASLSSTSAAGGMH